VADDRLDFVFKNSTNSDIYISTEYYKKKGPDYFLSQVRDIFAQDDITVINLEGSLTNSTDLQEKTWNHKGPPEYVQVLTGSSVEVATLGNNHRLDYGESGFKETKETLSAAGISYCYNHTYLAYEVKGVKFGFVSANEVYEGNGVMSYFKKGYESLREQGCQVIIACVHWGGDKTTVLEKPQLSMGCELIDMGYDLVVGNHPHILQAMRLYKGKFICYSLGNFCYGGSKNPKDKDSGIFQQTFHFRNGELLPQIDAKFIPCYLSSTKKYNDYCPTPAEGSEFQRIIDKMNGYSAQFGFALNEDGQAPEPEE
jgi:poly-gamma-glutamate synthesis protein (capsule biosynthesis protein)